jgi:hypothetical protein
MKSWCFPSILLFLFDQSIGKKWLTCVRGDASYPIIRVIALQSLISRISIMTDNRLLNFAADFAAGGISGAVAKVIAMK